MAAEEEIVPNVFLSWSGSRAKAMALALYEWLPDVIQAVVPFFSDKDIQTGGFWSEAIKKNLEAASFAIICFTPENVDAPWLNFEAGSLSIRLNGCTAPWLLDSRPEALQSSPLSLLMARTTDKDGTLQLLKSLNDELDVPLKSDRLISAFETHWPRLEQKLEAIPAPAVKTVEREPTDMLEEIVGLTRRIANDMLTKVTVEDLARRSVALDAFTSGSQGPQGPQGSLGPQPPFEHMFSRQPVPPRQQLATPWHSVRDPAKAYAIRFAKEGFNREITPEQLEPVLLAVRRRFKGTRINDMDLAAAITQELMNLFGGPGAPTP